MQQRLAAIRTDLQAAYVLYSDALSLNDLQSLQAGAHFTPHKDDLLSLYSFKTFTIKQLKNNIDDLQPFPLANVCQNCTINSVNSMDHVLGKAEFPEYSIHPYNLFPSCTECNGYKSTSFARDGVRRFLNLYSDQLPQVQYLFLDVFINSHGDLDYSFVLDKRNHIDQALFTLIQSHFERLYLFKRMKFHSIKYYVELRTSISIRLNDLSWAQVANQITREAQENKANLGNNHFQYVLQSELIRHLLFRNSFGQ